MAASLQNIETGLYRRILSRVPIPCVDLLIRYDKRILLLRRKNQPLKGEWWVVGGRIFLGEEPLEAVYRIARKETGIGILDPRFIGYYSDYYGENAFERTRTQTVSLVFNCHSPTNKVTLDSQSSAYKWSEGMPPRFADKLRNY